MLYRISGDSFSKESPVIIRQQSGNPFNFIADIFVYSSSFKLFLICIDSKLKLYLEHSFQRKTFNCI